MMYSELLSLTDGKATTAEFSEVEAAYMAREDMTKPQVASRWKRRYAEKVLKPRAKEMREIKETRAICLSCFTGEATGFV